jgi:hypothetical protein
MKVWIVCEPCEDTYYDGHPTGEVFTDKAKAEQYIAEKNGDPNDSYLLFGERVPRSDTFALYLTEGELK